MKTQSITQCFFRTFCRFRFFLFADDDNTGIFHVLEMCIVMNEFDHHVLALLKQQQERPFSLLFKQRLNAMIKFILSIYTSFIINIDVDSV